MTSCPLPASVRKTKKLMLVYRWEVSVSGVLGVGYRSNKGDMYLSYLSTDTYEINSDSCSEVDSILLALAMHATSIQVECLLNISIQVKMQVM